ncbi:MAG: M20/M25/M40 family metallo-hydrolase, partial [Pseudomonadota bacterium]|nr:M20/M25/M40 family metallo-hydrolase [Pseudomonadota bacterium]
MAASSLSAKSDLSLGRRVMALIEELAGYTDEPGRLTRLYLSPAHRAAAEATRRMMDEAGLEAVIDPAGSVIGRLAGTDPAAPAILIGSHIDSVVDAGRFDGNLGVVLGIVAAQALREAGGPAIPIEVVAFGDEENVRFPTNLSTSQALAGRYDPAWLDGRDTDGITLREALLRFGGDPDEIPGIARKRGAYRAYLEVH